MCDNVNIKISVVVAMSHRNTVSSCIASGSYNFTKCVPRWRCRSTQPANIYIERGEYGSYTLLHTHHALHAERPQLS